jgi:hypothetical protein
MCRPNEKTEDMNEHFIQQFQADVHTELQEKWQCLTVPSLLGELDVADVIILGAIRK